MQHPLSKAPYRRKRRRGQWLGAIALLGGCAQSQVEALPRPAGTAVILHNDGSAQRLATGAAVRFPGMLYIDFERGVWVANVLPAVPPPGVPAGPGDPDFICADLQIDVSRWGRLWPLSGRAVTVFGTVARRPVAEADACPLFLADVRVVRR